MGSTGSRLLRILLVGAIAGLSLTLWSFAGVAYACDPDIEDCEEEEEDPPETSPPHTSPPHTSPPHTSPPRTNPPATHPPATHAPATHAPAVGKKSTLTTRQHTQTTRRSSSGQTDTPTAPSEPFLDVPLAPAAPVDTGVQLPAVQLAGDAKAAPGVGTAADAGLPPLSGILKSENMEGYSSSLPSSASGTFSRYFSGLMGSETGFHFSCQRRKS